MQEKKQEKPEERVDAIEPDNYIIVDSERRMMGS